VQGGLVVVAAMVLIFLRLLGECFHIKIPAAFFYCSTRMILAMLTTLCVTILFGSRFINHLSRMSTGQSIRVEDCPDLIALYQKKKKTPTMGGMLMVCAMLLATAFWMDLQNVFTLLLFLATVWFALLGGRDDYLKMKHGNSKGMRMMSKFGLQALFSLLIALYLFWPSLAQSIHHYRWFPPPSSKEFVHKGEEPIVCRHSTTETYGRYYLPFKKAPLFILKNWGLILAFLMTGLVITGASNSVNLADGLDGLAVGCVLIVSFVLTVFAFLSNHAICARYLNILFLEGSGEIAIYLSAMIGACIGFLWYNGHPAQVFMGDVGSLVLGGVLGLSAVLLRREFLFAFVSGVFVIEALSVVLQVCSYRFLNKRRIFRCAPLHHHFEFKGWPEPKIVIRFWIIGLLLASVGLLSIKFQ